MIFSFQIQVQYRSNELNLCIMEIRLNNNIKAAMTLFISFDRLQLIFLDIHPNFTARAGMWFYNSKEEILERSKHLEC